MPWECDIMCNELGEIQDVDQIDAPVFRQNSPDLKLGVRFSRATCKWCSSDFACREGELETIRLIVAPQSAKIWAGLEPYQQQCRVFVNVRLGLPATVTNRRQSSWRQ